jgi:hypothetical protein
MVSEIQGWQLPPETRKSSGLLATSGHLRHRREVTYPVSTRPYIS